MHFLFQVSSVCQKQYLKKVMKIVLKKLMNRVGLPTDSLICALTTYMGFGGSALLRQRWQAESTFLTHWAGLSAHCPCLSKDWIFAGSLIMYLCVWGYTQVLLKYIENTYIQFLFVFYWAFLSFSYIFNFKNLIIRKNGGTKGHPEEIMKITAGKEGLRVRDFILTMNVSLCTRY